MFDIGFLEILVILIIALLVIGPERMPEVARKLGSFMGKTRNFINQMKQDSPLQDTVREVKDAMNLEEEKKHIDNIGKELEQGLNFNDVELDMDEFQRPFGGDANQQSSQFNKAPAQPNLPKESPSSAATQQNVAADSEASTTAAANNTANHTSSAPEKQTQEATETAVEPVKEPQKS